jgi:magnesium chelatase subunit ChlD-like protein
VRSLSGRRSRTRTTRKRGRYSGFEASPSDASDLAFDATFRAAAPHQRERAQTGSEGSGARTGGPRRPDTSDEKATREPAPPRAELPPPPGERSPRPWGDRGEGAPAHVRAPALHLRPEDYQRKVRVRRSANLIIFMVDASWSMAVSERMEATKGAILSLLTDAYQRRDRVGMIVFQKDRATLVLPPTNSVDLAKKMLVNLPVGGKTPLAAGLWLAYRTIQREVQRYPELVPLLVILTDGAGNVSMGDMPPQLEAYHVAEQIREETIKSIVINMEAADYDKGLAQALADHLGGTCYTPAALQAGALVTMVRDQLSI